MLQMLISEIIEKVQIKRPLFIAIDGRCAAGKTTLANNLQEFLKCSVIHMDDFFLRPEQRTEERYAQAGNNVDYERLIEEVMEPLKEGKAISYRPFLCSEQRLGEQKDIAKSDIYIFEGAYSCQTNLYDFYDFRIFLDVDEEEQLKRIEKRNGKEQLEMFKQKWIPLEERYFTEQNIRKRVDRYIKIAKEVS